MAEWLKTPCRLTVKGILCLREEAHRLQKGFLKAGKHRVTWRSTGLSSGTYLIRLHTHRHVETRKALFLQ